MAHNKSRLISGKVPVTNAASVPADRFTFLDLSSAEPNLGFPNTSVGFTSANDYVLTYIILELQVIDYGLILQI